MISFLMLGSLVLGLISWLLAFINIVRPKKARKDWVINSFFSLGACGLALAFQLIYAAHITRLGDWAALMDTLPTSLLLSLVLLIVCLLANGLSLYQKQVDS